MNKSQFINALDYRLRHINFEERENIINFYRELIDDKMELGKTEEEIIGELNIDQIVEEINQNGQVKPDQDSETTNSGFTTDTNDGTNQYKNTNNQTNYNNYQTSNKSKDFKTLCKDFYQKNTLAFWVIIIATSFIWFPILITVLSIIFACIVTLISLMFSGIVMIIGGIISLILVPFVSGLGYEVVLMQIGGSIIMIGVGLILLPLTGLGIKYLPKAIRSIIKGIKKVFTGGKNHA